METEERELEGEGRAIEGAWFEEIERGKRARDEVGGAGRQEGWEGSRGGGVAPLVFWRAQRRKNSLRSREGDGGGEKMGLGEKNGEEFDQVKVALVPVFETNMPDEFVLGGHVVVSDHAAVPPRAELHPDVSSY